MVAFRTSFFARSLADIADKKVTGRAIEAAPKWIAQSQCPDFPAHRRRGTSEWVISRNAVSASRGIDIDPQNLAQQRRIILRISTWLDTAGAFVIPVSAITRRDVEIVCVAGSRAEANPTAVVIALRLIEREQRRCRKTVRTRRDLDLRDGGNALAKDTAGRRVIGVELAVASIVGMEREPEQALFASAPVAQKWRKIDERCRVQRKGLKIENSYAAGLFDNEQPAGVGRGCGDEDGGAETRRNPDGRERSDGLRLRDETGAEERQSSYRDDQRMND